MRSRNLHVRMGRGVHKEVSSRAVAQGRDRVSSSRAEDPVKDKEGVDR